MTTLDSTVKIPRGVIFQQLDGEAVLLSTQSEVFFGLDPVGTQIWQLLENHGELRTVVGALLEKYDVGQEQLEKEVLEFIEKLHAKGLVAIDRTNAKPIEPGTLIGDSVIRVQETLSTASSSRAK